ncbi:MAG: OpgC domain-containing protein [Burkholderiales bacterium]
MTRQPEIDALRGLMLVLMCVSHLPTRFAEWLGQPFGFVSAAEGFVFLSAYLVGLVYSGRARRFGQAEMRKALWRRAAVVYRSHVAMLAFLFTIIAWIGIRSERQAITNLISFYLQEPWTALWTSAALIYTPPLLDILPMYVLFMAASPLVLPLAMRPGGKAVVIALSALLWIAAQFGLNDVAYAAVAKSIHHRVPLDQNGAFDLWAWQFVWALGLCLGARRALATGRSPVVSARLAARIAAVALCVALGCMLWRHAVGQAPFPGVPQFDVLFDKWHLGPLRMLNFFALAVVLMHFGPRLAPLARAPGLQLLGRQSLPAFCAHLVVVLIALSVIGDSAEQLSIWTELGVVGGTLLIVGFVAWVASENGRKGRSPQGIALGVQMQAVGGEKLPAR